MVILSLAVSTSSKLGLLISMLRNLLGLRFALGVFVRMEYSRHRHAVCYSDSSADTLCSPPQRPRFPAAIPALFENLDITRDRFGTVFEKVPRLKIQCPVF